MKQCLLSKPGRRTGHSSTMMIHPGPQHATSTLGPSCVAPPRGPTKPGSHPPGQGQPHLFHLHSPNMPSVESLRPASYVPHRFASGTFPVSRNYNLRQMLFNYSRGRRDLKEDPSDQVIPSFPFSDVPVYADTVDIESRLHVSLVSIFVDIAQRWRFTNFGAAS